MRISLSRGAPPQTTVHNGGNEGLQAPREYMERCGAASPDNSTTTIMAAYCGLMIMLDEAVGNTMCALRKSGLAENTLGKLT